MSYTKDQLEKKKVSELRSLASKLGVKRKHNDGSEKKKPALIRSIVKAKSTSKPRGRPRRLLSDYPVGDIRKKAAAAGINIRNREGKLRTKESLIRSLHSKKK